MTTEMIKRMGHAAHYGVSTEVRVAMALSEGMTPEMAFLVIKAGQIYASMPEPEPTAEEMVTGEVDPT